MNHLIFQTSIPLFPIPRHRPNNLTFSGTGVNGRKDAHKYSAISDTGTSFIVGPKAPLEKLAKAVDAKYDSINQIYKVDCNAKFQWSIWVGGVELAVDDRNLIWEYQPGVCYLAYEGWDPTPGEPEYILGDPIIRQFCQIYDVQNKRIGFAKAGEQ